MSIENGPEDGVGNPMHDDIPAEIHPPRVPDALANDFAGAVERLRAMVRGQRELVMEAEAFAEAARNILTDLHRCHELDGCEREALEASLVQLLDNITSVA